MNLDLDAYLARIGFVGTPTPDLEFLRSVHRLHPAAIPFENLSTLLRAPVPLDLESLQRKLVDDRRGGYCFEQNRLFAAMLEQIGFEVLPLAARVIWNQRAGMISPRTHMILLVGSGGDRQLCDVGFGGVTLTAPLEFVCDRVQSTPHEDFRLIARGGSEYELQARLGRDESGHDVWRGTYLFDLQPQTPIDYELANHYVATHPTSHFRSQLIAARPFDSGRYALANTELTVHRLGHPKDTRRLADVDEIKTALETLFGIVLPAASHLDEVLAGIVAAAR
jgi:N-hydroxyarylamine O-acetyltransferase